MIRAANDVEAVIAIFAAAAIGCEKEPASLMLTAEEALALAADAGASAIVLGDADPSERALFASMRVFDRDDIVRLAAEGSAGGLRADRARRPGLSRLHLRLDRRAQGGAARAPGGDRPPADGGRLARA